MFVGLSVGDYLAGDCWFGILFGVLCFIWVFRRLFGGYLVVLGLNALAW